MKLLAHLLSFAFVLTPYFLFGQSSAPGASSGTYQDVKYCLAMPNHIQLAYDGATNMKKISGPMFDLGDKAYYNGKYINAASRYRMGFADFPIKTNKLLQLSAGLDVISAAKAVNASVLNIEQARIYSGGLNTLAIYYHGLGHYHRALEFYNMSMKIRGERLGKTSAAFISSLQNIANLKKDLGEYDEAEHIFSYLDRVLSKLFTRSSSHYAIFLNNKAMLYASLGRTEDALVLLGQCLISAKEFLDPGYIDYERILTNQGILQMELGDLKSAESSFLSAMKGMSDKGYGKHPDHNDIQIYLGNLYIQTNSANALSFIGASTDAAKRRYGSLHSLYAKALENKGLYYMKKDDYNSALEVYGEAATIYLAVFGSKHRNYLNALVMKGVCAWNLGEVDLADGHFKKSYAGYLFILDNFFPSFSESEKGEFWALMKPNIEIYLSFVADNFNAKPSLKKDAFNLHVRTKGILLNSITKTKDLILHSGDTNLIGTYNEWVEAKDLLAYYYSLPKEVAKEDKVDLDDLEFKANELEKELSRRSSKFNQDLSDSPDFYTDIKNSLGPSEAVLDIARISPTLGPKKGRVLYLNFIIKKNIENPNLLVLENGEDLENKFHKFYKNTIIFKLNDEKSYAAFWGSHEQNLVGIDHLYLSPDGIYNNINIKSLKNPEGKYMVEERKWTMVSNSKYVLSNKSRTTNPEKQNFDAVLLGNPNFGNDELLSPLPGTQIEIQKIDDLLKKIGYSVSVFTKETATEESLKSIDSPHLLHLATHGFFLPDVKNTEGMVAGIQVAKAKGNPLLRSGLMLSNSGKSLSNDFVLGSKSNGIMNAFEAMDLNLENTDLVVLSACETGSGEIVNGEGVYGLPRALQVAGAKNIIMSLWKVDDTATQELMESFYQNWTGGESMSKSLQTAQKVIMEKYKHPYYWGAFVLMEN